MNQIQYIFLGSLQICSGIALVSYPFIALMTSQISLNSLGSVFYLFGLIGSFETLLATVILLYNKE